MTKIIKILSAIWLNIRKILGLNRKKCQNKCWTLLGVFSGFFERYWYDKILPNFEYVKPSCRQNFSYFVHDDFDKSVKGKVWKKLRSCR